MASHLAHAQHRNAYYLMLNIVTGAVAGLGFWFIVARIAGLSPAEVGVGFAIVSLGTIIGVLAKGGLDTALLRTVPGASHDEGLRLARFAMLLGIAGALVLTLLLALASALVEVTTDASFVGWVLVGAIGLLLVVTWLQDAYFLAEGDAKFSFQRNLIFSAARLLLPVPLALFAVTRPVAVSWAAALAVSALAAAFFVRRFPHREGRHVPRREFVRSAVRNVSGSAAEFLPGLLLAPLVLALDGAESAGYFGIAWAAASLLFLGSAAISRSALAEMVRNGHNGLGHAVRRGAFQHGILVLPAAIAGALLAPYLLSIFGSEYAREGAATFAILCASAIVVAPVYFYLAVLRAREETYALVAFPAAMIAVLFVLVPWMVEAFGLPGAAIAWFAANTPFGLYAAARLRLVAQELSPHGTPTAFSRAPHVE